MSATLKQPIVTEAGAQELWRVAETNDVEELARILPRAGDINARNKHGMTALMRASHHGNERMVKALLDHGADPNLTRHDKFTALALAAFFGHTETVRILIDHGAKTEVVTRSGTSAYMWAAARTFDDTARCLKSHTRVSPARPTGVVKTLKEPPEIWDLVHEVPRGFNPGTAFVSRIQSMKTSFALRIAAVLAISTACVVGALVLRDSQARNLPEVLPVALQNQSAAPDQSATEIRANPAASIEAVSSHHVVAPNVEDGKRNGSRKPHIVSRYAYEPTAVAEEVEKKEVTAAPAVVASPKIEPKSAQKPVERLSPQLIAPAKNAPPKGKVIQWP